MYTHTHTHTNTHKGVLLSHKKECHLQQMDAPGDIIQTEVSQIEKDKYDITYMWNLKKRERYK